MKVIADVCIIPIGVGVSLSPYIKRIYQLFQSLSLNATVNAYGTVLEGEYTDVTNAIEKAMLLLKEDGVPRVTMTIKLGARFDKEQSAADKINSVI